MRAGNGHGYPNECQRSSNSLLKNANIASKYDSIKKSNKSVKRELKDILAGDSLESPDLGRYDDNLSTEADVGDLKRANCPPKMKVNKEQDNSIASLIVDFDHNDIMVNISH